MKQTIGQRIAEQRKKCNLTQNELAEKLMVSNKAVSKWESDNGNPSIEFLEPISKILNCSIDYLITGNEFENKNINLPVSFDFQDENPYLEDLTIFSHTNVYCDTEEEQNILINNISKSIINSPHTFPTKLYSINKSKNHKDIIDILNNVRQGVLNRQPLAFPIGESSKHNSEYVFPATNEKPYVVLLIKELNDFLQDKEIENLITQIINLGKACGIFVIAVNTTRIHEDYKEKFKTTIRYEKIGCGDSQIHTPIILDQFDFEDELKNITKYNLPINLGYDKHKNIDFDIEQLVGTLIVGETGSGKSNLLHHIITQLIKNYYSTDVQFALIDSKYVEFYPYFKLGHLYSPIARSKDEITNLLKKCCEEMDKRYDYLSKLGLNCRASLQDKKSMPYLIIMIDEVLELVHIKENLEYIQRLLQLGRACGIFMYIASQSTKKEQIPTCITLNVATKISFKLPNQEISNYYLGAPGAENLNEKGSMIIKTPFMDYKKLQVPYISENSIKNILRTI